MNTQKYFIIIVVTLLTALILTGQTCSRKSMTSGGFISEGDNFYGFSAGQASQAHVYTAEGDTATYGYWHKTWEPMICVSVLPDSVWDVRDDIYPDTIPNNYTVTMLDGDNITVSNCGNCAIDLGLRFLRADPDSIAVGYSSGANRAVIRARFRDDDECPIVYDRTRDWIKNVLTWASSGVSGVFGYSGVNLATNETMNLWFQLVTPWYVRFGDSYISNFQLMFG